MTSSKRCLERVAYFFQNYQYNMLKCRAGPFAVPTPFRLVYVFVVVASVGRYSVGVNEGVPQPPLEDLEIRVGMTVNGERLAIW